MTTDTKITPEAPPDSPCIGICRLDESGAWCLGCGRLRSELFNWAEKSPEERSRIIEAARLRLSKKQP